MPAIHRELLQLRIAAINVNSIIANYRRLELSDFTQKYSHDRILLSETILNAKHKLAFKEYNSIRKGRPNSNHGGWYCHSD